MLSTVGPPAEDSPGSRRHLTDELLEELTNWNPRERMIAFKTWVRGALSLIQLHVLAVLEAHGTLSMGRLAQAMDVSVASVTGIVTRMAQRGLVERRHAETDRRVVWVTMTNAGKAVFRELQQARRAGLRTLLSRLSEEEMRGLLSGLRALNAARRELGSAGVTGGKESEAAPPFVTRGLPEATPERPSSAQVPQRPEARG